MLSPRMSPNSRLRTANLRWLASVGAAHRHFGTGPDSPDAVAKISAPVYGFYGSNDARVNATIPKSKELMEKAGKKYEPVVYEGAGHGFMRAGEEPNAQPANKKARDEAWVRMEKLLKAI
jgi:carboxymethylenebutenolidase